LTIAFTNELGNLHPTIPAMNRGCGGWISSYHRLL